MALRNLIRRGLTWYARLHVPRARQADVGRVEGAKNGTRSEVVRTLQTRDHQEALARRDAALAALRRDLDAKLRTAGLAPLTAWEPSWADRATDMRWRLQTASDTPYSVEEGPNGELSPWTAKGDVLDEARDEYRDVLASEGPSTAERYWAIATGDGPTIAEARDEWLAEVERGGARRAQTTAGHRAALALLEAYLRAHAGAPSLDVTPMDAVTRKVAAGFVAWRTSTVSPKTGRPLNAATVRREVSSFSGLWRWARRRDAVQAIPWEDQTAALPKRRREDADDYDDPAKRPFRPAELVALLRAGADAWAPNGGGYAATLWDATRLALLTGLRANELASVTVADVLENGTALRVVRGKTASAARVIPLCDPAAAVVAQRLASLPDQSPKAPLWPELPPQGPDGRRGKMLSSRFGQARPRVLRGAAEGQDPRGADFHSFRRSFAAALRDAMNAGERTITPNLIDCLMGHAGATLALNRYAPGALAADMRRAVNAMVLHGLDPLVRVELENTQDRRPPMLRTAPATQRTRPAPIRPSGANPRVRGGPPRQDAP